MIKQQQPDTEIVMNSRQMAELTGKQHGNLLIVIRKLVNSRQIWIEESTYEGNRTGLSFPEFKMTKAQALFVANRFPAHQRERVRSSLALAESSLVPQRAKETKQQLTATALIDPNVATMTSEQIADLVGSRHTDVKRSIDRLVDRDVIHLPPSAVKEIGGGRPGSMYVFTGEQGKRDSIIVVAQISPEFTARLVDRWQELEAHVAKPAPANLSDAASLRGLLLGYTEKVLELEHQVGIQAEKIAEDKPKADYYAHVRDSKNTETIGAFAKVLGFGRNKLFAWLRDQNILMHDNMPHQKHIDHGHFRVLDKDHITDKGKKITYKQTVLTGKGKTYVQKRLKKAGNPDLGEDD